MNEYKMVVSQNEDGELFPLYEVIFKNEKQLLMVKERIKEIHELYKENLQPSEDWVVDFKKNDELTWDPVVTRREFGKFLAFEVDNIFIDLDKFEPEKKAKKGGRNL